MSGHSKWSTIKRKKEKTDAQRAKVFTKIGREIMVAVREGGGDPNGNAKLRDLIAKAKANNVPNDNIDRLIKKAAGNSEKTNFESNVYEGYGPDGVAVIVETLTDNKNRTASEMRHYFDKCGGNLGTTGCVSFLFETKGVILIENEGIDEDALMEAAMDAGAEDFMLEDDAYEIDTAPNDLHAVSSALTEKGYQLLSFEVEQVPSTYTAIDDEEKRTKMSRLLEMLEDNDDVQQVWHNWENPPEE